MFKNKKGQAGFNVLLGAAISLVVMVVGAAFGIQIMSESQDDARCNRYNGTNTGKYNSSLGRCVTAGNGSCQDCSYTVSLESDAYGEGVAGVAKFPAKSALLAGIVILVIVITLLLGLSKRGGR